jgi:RimJ/RimL family protein N-acetyltransferase
MPALETPRLVLRPFVLADAPVVQRLAGAAEVASTTQNIPHPYEDGMAEKWIESHEENWETAKVLTLAMVVPDEGVVGAIGLHLQLDHLRGELGYWVGVPFWGRGYATEAAAAVMAFGFDTLQLNRIQARYMTRNPSSGRVMEKLGMSPEGVHRQFFRIRGQFEDIGMYAILRSDWAARQSFASSAE